MKRSHAARLKALMAESARLDAAYEKLLDDRLALARESCPFAVGDDVALGHDRRKCRVIHIEGPAWVGSKTLWRMTVRPWSGNKLLKGGVSVFAGDVVERWAG